MKKHLTIATVKSLRAKKTDYEVADSELPCLKLRVSPKGNKSFGMRYSFRGKRMRYTIGSFPVVSPEIARNEALEILRQIRQGVNPANEKKQQMQRGITIAELCGDYMERGASHKAASTLALDKGRIKRHIKPLLGEMQVSDLTKADVAKLIKDISEGKTAVTEKTGKHGKSVVRGGANAARDSACLLSSMLTFATEQGFVESNVAIGVKKPSIRKVERFLNEEELACLGAELLREDYNIHARHIIRLLLLTGCRLNEITSLKHEYVDIERQCLRLPYSKTGARAVGLGVSAVEFIKTLPKFQSPYIFPSIKTHGQFYVGTQGQWDNMRTAAGITDCRLHDLRHTFGSIAAQMGYSMETIGALLGHTTGGTTSRYIHFGTAALGKAATDISETIKNRLNAGLPNVEL